MLLSLGKFYRTKRDSISSPKTCVICLENGKTQKLPCPTCLNKYIHKSCLEEYTKHNTGDNQCFVCNSGNLVLPESVIVEIRDRSPRRRPTQRPRRSNTNRSTSIFYFLFQVIHFVIRSMAFFFCGAAIFFFFSIIFLNRNILQELHDNNHRNFSIVSAIIGFIIWAIVYAKKGRNPCVIKN